jgi:hypothetical protein
MMSFGFIMSGCGNEDESVTVDQVGTGDAVSVTDNDAPSVSGDVTTSTGEIDGSASSDDAETDGDVTNPVAPESEPDGSELPGDPTEDPSGDESSFYSFEAWNIPAHNQDDEDDNR